MTPRPRPALFAALAAAAVLNLLTRTSGVAWLALASAAALALPVASVVARPRLDRLQIDLVLPARVTAGDVVEGELRVRNPGRTWSAAGHWELEHEGLPGLRSELPALGPGEQVRLPLSGLAVRRGVFAAATVRLVSTAPFGLLAFRSERAVSQRLVVHPVTGATRALQAEGAPTAADSSVPVAGIGTEVLGLRPWRQGDALRHLSARASARHGRPVVLERERETGPSLVVLAVGGGAGDAWEQAVSTVASLCVAALREGRPPVVLTDPPAARLDAVGLLDLFAGVDGCGPPRPQDLAAALQACGAGGTLVLLAPPGAEQSRSAVRRAAGAAGVRVQVLG